MKKGVRACPRRRSLFDFSGSIGYSSAMDELFPDTAKRVEDSIKKKFHKTLFSRFTKAIVEYELIQPNDKIAVCMSGGKDSFVMAKLFQELKRHNKIPFELTFLVMDPGYSAENRAMIESNAEAMNIPITVFETDIFENVYNIEPPVMYARVCAAGTFTIRLRIWAATKLLWGTTTTTLSKRYLWVCFTAGRCRQ